MFRAQQNAFDDVVVKATDENLTSENWEYILDVCDKVAAVDSGPKDAVAAMIKRLAHRNANVQLYTLELANALSQNCGVKMHQELASRSFTDALLRLAADRNTHQQVKSKILERMAEWTQMFSRNPDLGIMEQAYMKLKTQNPNLHPPSKPQKAQITDLDRRKEEEELQMALRLSIQDKGPSSSSQAAPSASGAAAAAQGQSAAPAQPIQSGTTAATVSRVRALFDFQPSEPGELQFKKGDVIAVIESVYKDWWKGSLRGQTGIFPLNYVEKLADPTPEELQREAQMEAEVFGQIKNVEKLLALLSTSSSDLNVRDNEEITTLYHSTLAIRPKLIELIGKYSQKKDEFTQLNEKFIKARRDYENLLEASMSQPPPPTQYGGRASYGYGGGYPPTGGAAADPQRFYSPSPANQEVSYPSRNGPQPFYMQTGQDVPPQDPRRTPQPGPADPYAQQRIRPQSAYNPQELSTAAYDSPVDPRHSYGGQPSQPPAQGYPPAGAPSQSPGGPSYPPASAHPNYDSPSSAYSTGPDGAYPAQPGQAAPQPSHAPPGVPGSPGQQNPYPALNAGLPQGGPVPAPGHYQAYRPQGQGQWGGAPGVPGGARGQGEGGDASDFYR